MPHFNEFRINEDLLGKVLVARKGEDLPATYEEHTGIRRIMNELEGKKRSKWKRLKSFILEMLKDKKLIRFKCQNNGILNL